MMVIASVDFSVTIYLNLSNEHPSSCSVEPTALSIAELNRQITVESSCVFSYRHL